MPTGELHQLFVQGLAKDVQNSLNERQLGLHLLLDSFHRSFLVKINNDLRTAYHSGMEWGAVQRTGMCVCVCLCVCV